MMQHYYKQVEGWAAFARLYTDFAVTLEDNMILVEVGSWLGRSAALMGVEIENSGKNGVALYCVDPWIDGGPDLRNTDHFKKLTKPIYDTFLENIKPVAPHIVPMRMTSLEAAQEFDGACVDMLMLDGDHSYEAVKADLAAWLPKMKEGSLISGDDYMWPGVKKAVDEVFGPTAVVNHVKHHPNYLLSKSYWWVRL